MFVAIADLHAIPLPLHPQVNWEPANYSAFYHLFLVDIDGQFLHSATVNIPGGAFGLGYKMLPYFQPSPPDTITHRYVWALFRTDMQITISPAEAQSYFTSPLFSRANFNMTAYAEAHNFGPEPIAVTWQLETVDAYIAYTWQ